MPSAPDPTAPAAREGGAALGAYLAVLLHRDHARDALLADLHRYGEPQDPRVRTGDVVVALLVEIDRLRALAAPPAVAGAGGGADLPECIRDVAAAALAYEQAADAQIRSREEGRGPLFLAMQEAQRRYMRALRRLTDVGPAWGIASAWFSALAAPPAHASHGEGPMTAPAARRGEAEDAAYQDACLLRGVASLAGLTDNAGTRAALSQYVRAHAAAFERLAALAQELPSVLAWHHLTGVLCDEATHTDVATCACALWRSEPQPSAGEAVQRWAEHVMDALAAPPAPAPAGDVVEPPSPLAHTLVEAALDACVAAERCTSETPAERAESRRRYTAALDARNALLDYIAHLEAPAPAPARAGDMTEATPFDARWEHAVHRLRDAAVDFGGGPTATENHAAWREGRDRVGAAVRALLDLLALTAPGAADARAREEAALDRAREALQSIDDLRRQSHLTLERRANLMAERARIGVSDIAAARRAAGEGR